MDDKINYENLYWKEVEENIKLNEEIEQLKWKIHRLESKIKSLENMGKYEKNMINSRWQAGRLYHREHTVGYHEGRPKKFNQEQIKLGLKLLDDHSYKQVEQMTGISKSTLIRAKREQNL
jgi:DNA invertase Pin-like site-specific DNA recombinase